MNDETENLESEAALATDYARRRLLWASEEINELAGALAAAQVELKNPRKTKKVKIGGKYDFNYTPLEDILDAVRPVLGKQGIAIQQGTRETNKGTLLFTRLMHKSGQWSESSLLIGKYEQMQGLGAAMTYFKRYSLCGMVGIAGMDDVEPDAKDIDNKSAGAPPRPERGDYPPDDLEIIDRAGEILEREGVSPEEARRRAREEAAQPPDGGTQSESRG